MRVPELAGLGVELDLEMVKPFLRPRARDAFNEGDGARFVIYAIGESALRLVQDNMSALKQRGCYEAALIAAYTGCKTNHFDWPVSVLIFMFQYGDLDKFQRCGGPLPATCPVRVYRGVCGRRPHRHVRGLSWTTSSDRACWFALGWVPEDPAVFTAVLPRHQIFCCTNARRESEIIGMPSSCRRLPMTIDQIREGKDRQCVVDKEERSLMLQRLSMSIKVPAAS